MPYVRYVGQRDPVEVHGLDVIEAEIKRGKLTKEQVWEYNARRTVQLDRVTIRILTPEDGFSRRYQWGPEVDTFVQFMTDEDWTKLQEDMRWVNPVTGQQPMAGTFEVTEQPTSVVWIERRPVAVS